MEKKKKKNKEDLRIKNEKKIRRHTHLRYKEDSNELKITTHIYVFCHDKRDPRQKEI